MNPAKSVIFFTVVSGLGLGLYVVGGIYLALGVWQPSGSEINVWLGSATAALVAGLGSSSFHLTNPKNAWRAWMRFRTSWLSREAVLAVVVVGLAFLLYLLGGNSAVLAAMLAVAALLTLYSTGMIYACLKTIRQWNTPLTPAYYVLAGCSAGALLFAVLFDHAWALVWLLLLLAAAVKAAYYALIVRPSGPDLRSSTGLGSTAAGVRLLEVGHSGGTFLTREFGGQLAESKLQTLRMAVFVFSLVLPAAAIAIGLGPLALLLLLVGHAVERWLFFTEAKHVVRLYHGQST